MSITNYETTLVTSYCEAPSLLQHIKYWLRNGYNLTAVSRKSNLNVHCFNARDILEAVRCGVSVFLTTVGKATSIRINLAVISECNLLPFSYVYMSKSRMNKPMPVGVRTGKQHLTA